MHGNTAVIILAAGDGKRMKSTTPKVMHLLRGKPLVEHVVDAAADALEGKPYIVVSSKHTLIQDCLQERANYVLQPEQLGTGNAVLCVEPALKDAADLVVVLYGDMPLLKSNSIRQLVNTHREEKNTVTVMTTTVPNFDGQFAPFWMHSRVVRRADGGVKKIVEKKDCTEEQLLIQELNTCFFCFDAAWMWGHLKLLKTDNAQKEYYLVDLVEMAITEEKKVSTISIDPTEAMGINSQEDLQIAEQILTS